MKKILVALMLSFFGITNAQETTKDLITKEVMRVLDSINKSKAFEVGSINGVSNDSLKETVNAHSEKFSALDEKLSEMSGDVSAFKKLKISGYVQAQYEMYDWWNASGNQHGTSVIQSGQAANFISNSAYIRRARVKFIYEAVDGVAFVLCPNFDIDKVTIKDAYVQLNDRWTQTFALWMGQFSKTTYEIEFSSASREFAERSQMSRTLYPTERDQGAKLEANFDTKYNIPLFLQFSVFNGNFGKGTVLLNQVKDIDNKKDVMVRAVYSLKMPSQGLGIDFGGHGYFGHNTVLTPTVTTMPTFTDVNNNSFTPQIGDNLKQQWFGGEMRAYWDFLGGVQLKSEYIAGTLSTFNIGDFPQIGYVTPGQPTGTATTNVNKVRNFAGYYVSLIKNIGKDHQIAVRIDSFDPNTKLSGDQVSNSNDLKYNNWSYAYQYFFNANIKVQLTYNMPINEKSANDALVGTDFANTDKKDNTFTVRLQARF